MYKNKHARVGNFGILFGKGWYILATKATLMTTTEKVPKEVAQPQGRRNRSPERPYGGEMPTKGNCTLPVVMGEKHEL